MRYAQLVMGPAGAGKSTYCDTMQRHAADAQRDIKVVNLDPACEAVHYTACCDVRDLITVDDAMDVESLDYGPNGGLVFCMEYLLDNMDDFRDLIDAEADDDYILFDCPGQIELYTHMDLMRDFIGHLQQWDFRVCAVFMIDAHYMVDSSKFLSASLAATSAMMSLEVPHVNLVTKMDLLDRAARHRVQAFLDTDTRALLGDGLRGGRWSERFSRLTAALAQVLDEQHLVSYVALNREREESVRDALLMIDQAIQYGEDAAVKPKDFDFADPEPEEEVGNAGIFD